MYPVSDVVNLISPPPTPTVSVVDIDSLSCQGALTVSSTTEVPSCVSETSPLGDEHDIDPLSITQPQIPIRILVPPEKPITASVASRFAKNPITGLFAIMRNINTETIWAPESIPQYFPVSPYGSATVLSIAKKGPFAFEDIGLSVSLRSESAQRLANRLKSRVPYALKMKQHGVRTVQFAGRSFPVSRIKGMCSGVNNCINSRDMNSKHHAGYVGDCHFDN